MMPISIIAAVTLHLHGRAFDGTIGAEHAAVTPRGTDQSVACDTFMKEAAGVERHRLRCLAAALWTRQS